MEFWRCQFVKGGHFPYLRMRPNWSPVQAGELILAGGFSERQQFVDFAVRPGGEFFQGIF
jgi:hypothetical protein